MKKYYAIIGMEKETFSNKEHEFVELYELEEERDAQLKSFADYSNKKYWNIRPATLVEEK